MKYQQNQANVINLPMPSDGSVEDGSIVTGPKAVDEEIDIENDTDDPVQVAVSDDPSQSVDLQAVPAANWKRIEPQSQKAFTKKQRLWVAPADPHGIDPKPEIFANLQAPNGSSMTVSEVKQKVKQLYESL